jgi:hypothetical protein
MKLPTTEKTQVKATKTVATPTPKDSQRTLQGIAPIQRKNRECV